MKQQLEQENKQENTVHDPNREHMTLSALWQLWMDNLKSWRQYRDEHPDLFTLNLQAGVRHIAAWFRQVGGSAHHLVDENRHSSFPESEHGAAQLFLFFWNSLSRLGASLRERARNARKKLIRAGDRRRSYFEKLKLHPVAFLAGAMGLAAAATVLSLYTVGAHAVYDGTDLGVVSSQHAVELAGFLAFCGCEAVVLDEAECPPPTGWKRAKTHSVFGLAPGCQLPLPEADAALWQSLAKNTEPAAGKAADMLFPDRPSKRDDFYSEFCSKRSRGLARVWTLEREGNIICTVGAYALANGQAYMACGETVEALRGKGVGGRLIVEMANALAAEGWMPVFLCSPERVHFYTRLGFEKMGEYARYAAP